MVVFLKSTSLSHFVDTSQFLHVLSFNSIRFSVPIPYISAYCYVRRHQRFMALSMYKVTAKTLLVDVIRLEQNVTSLHDWSILNSFERSILGLLFGFLQDRGRECLLARVSWPYVVAILESWAGQDTISHFITTPTSKHNSVPSVPRPSIGAIPCFLHLNKYSISTSRTFEYWSHLILLFIITPKLISMSLR